MSNEDVKVKATAKKPAARTTKAKKPAAKPATRKPAVRKTPTKKAPEATVAKPKTAAPKVKKATAPSPTPKSAKPSTQKVKKDDGAKDQSALIHQLQEQVALLTHRVMTLEKDFANLPTQLFQTLSTTFKVLGNNSAQRRFNSQIKLVDDVNELQNNATLFLEVDGKTFTVFGVDDGKRYDVYSSQTGFFNDAIFNPIAVTALLADGEIENGVHRINIYNV